jgi:hypothetical protein
MTVYVIDVVVARLKALGLDPKEMPSGWQARCPCHDDTDPSLSVNVEKGKLLLFCHAGCKYKDIVAKLGLSPSKGKPGEKRTTYEIRDVNGEVVAVHVRIDSPDGKKHMPWYGPDGEQKLDVRLESLPLFGSELLAKRPDDPVIVTEGEKAATSLQERGYLALATVTGAKGSPSREVLRSLKGRSVYLWPDNDTVGAEHMRKVARRLRGIA